MLSRTADHLYWMARNIERAENMARVLDVTQKMALLAHAGQQEAALWLPPVMISGNLAAFQNQAGELNAAQVFRYLALDENNPTSIVSSLNSARENARAVRVAMSSEMWENVNALWLELRARISVGISENELSEFCEWVKSSSHLFRGVTSGTMLRDDAHRFVQLGTFIERADNTARLLDVKYHLLLPSQESVGGALDYYEWSSLLRSVSSFEAYQKVFRDTIEPWRVAELLVLRADLPRSLHACLDEVLAIVEQLSSGAHQECLRLAGELHARLHYGSMEAIFQAGLHEFLADFIQHNNRLGLEIQRAFLSPPL